MHQELIDGLCPLVLEFFLAFLERWLENVDCLSGGNRARRNSKLHFGILCLVVLCERHFSAEQLVLEVVDRRVDGVLEFLLGEHKAVFMKEDCQHLTWTFSLTPDCHDDEVIDKQEPLLRERSLGNRSGQREGNRHT